MSVRRNRIQLRRTGRGLSGFLLALVMCTSLLPASGSKPWELAKFAVQMARNGNWREANYRWTQVEREYPDNPKLLSNLAVSLEALGRFEEAETYYNKALELSDGEIRIQDNYRRFALFRRHVRAANEQHADRESPPEREIPTYSSRARKKGKAYQVTVSLPVPPRLQLEGGQTILVASFLSDESALLDTNRELVRFLRNEFRKRTDFEVLPVSPPPAVPEQTVEDLVANAEFWKFLSDDHSADIIVSGVINFMREDTSGFRDVDVVSNQTGQKVRQTRFVDQERFRYSVDLFFMDGKTGNLLHRDALQRSVQFRGQSNDPISAFYELSESVAGDVLAVVTSSRREDTRMVFRL